MNRAMHNRALPRVVAALFIACLLPVVASKSRGNAALVPSASCAANVADHLVMTHGAKQIITVVAARLRSTSATLTLFQLSGTCYKVAGGPWTARVGRAGLSAHHTEGDGTTPIGAITFSSTIYGIDPNPGVSYRYHRLVCGDWWDEDSSSASYNEFVHVPCGTSPSFGGDSEALWRAVATYGYLAVIDYNTDPVVKDAGSGIFFHVSDGNATAGCVSLPQSELLQALRWMNGVEKPLIVIGVGNSVTKL